MQTIDISVDHFGYMIQWGTFAWVNTQHFLLRAIESHLALFGSFFSA